MSAYVYVPVFMQASGCVRACVCVRVHPSGWVFVRAYMCVCGLGASVNALCEFQLIKLSGHIGPSNGRHIKRLLYIYLFHKSI